jgi:hypothetical protein
MRGDSHYNFDPVTKEKILRVQVRTSVLVVKKELFAGCGI